MTECEEKNWYRVTDGISEHTTDDWNIVIEVVTGWYDYTAEYESPKNSPDLWLRELQQKIDDQIREEEARAREQMAWLCSLPAAR
jgi:hypothetical protein